MTKQDNGSYGGDEQLNVVFSRQDVFEKAKYFYENQSSFYPSDINDEFRTFVFDIENGEADVTERYLDQELQEKGLDGYYFEIADKYAEGGGIGNDKMKVNITKNEFQTRKDDPNRVFHWYEGNIGDYTFTAETDSNGINGINKGSIYNLYISKVGGSNIARYDNKWEYRSKNTKDGAVRSAVIKYIDSISDKKDGESKYKDGDMNEYSKGGNIIERRYVNKDQDYETRYAKNRPSRMGYKDERKFAVGGEIGNTVIFSRYGERTTGRVTDKLRNGYEVVTDEGTVLVEPQEVISFSDEPIAKKKRFGFFAGGGEIENKIEKLKKVVSSKMLPESVKAKAQAEIDKLEKELHESKETKAEEKAEHKAGGSEAKSKLEKDLEKELHRLQRDLNSFRLQIYTEGDDSEKEKARQRERTSKIIRMNEVLALLNEIEIGKENKMTGESEGERKAGMDEEKDYIEAKTKALEKSLKDKTISETQRKRDEKELALFKGAEAKKPTTTSKKEVVGYAIVDPISGEIVVSKKTIRQLIEASEKLEKTKGFEDMGDLAYEIIKKDDKNVLGDKIKSVDIKSLPIGKKPTTRKAPVRKAVVKKAVVKKTEPKSEFEVGDKVTVKGETHEIKEKKYIDYLGGDMTWAYKIPTFSFYVRESDVEAYKKPKADHKKLVAKLKAKKGATPSNEPSKGHKRSESSDKKRSALPLGKRISADGNKYYENRLNRADISKEDKFEDGGEVKGSDWGLNLNW